MAESIAAPGFPVADVDAPQAFLDDQNSVADARINRVQRHHRMSGGLAFGSDVFAQHDPRVIVPRVLLRGDDVSQDFGENHFS